MGRCALPKIHVQEIDKFPYLKNLARQGFIRTLCRQYTIINNINSMNELWTNEGMQKVNDLLPGHNPVEHTSSSYIPSVLPCTHSVILSPFSLVMRKCIKCLLPWTCFSICLCTFCSFLAFPPTFQNLKLSLFYYLYP